MRVCRKEAPVGGARDRICFKSMNTNTLEYILAIAEERSISKAARRFYLSQADLSRHLKRVEKDLGVSLFTRHRDGVELTPAGIIFINDARTILHMEKKLMKDLSVMREQKQYTIRVMTDEPFYNFFVKTASVMFKQAHPEYKLVYESCNSMQARRAILSGGADLGLFYSSSGTAADMEYVVCDTMNFFLVFPKNFEGPPDRNGLRAAVQGGMPVILYPAGHTARMQQEEHLIRAGIYPTSILEGNGRNCIAHVSEGGVCGILASRFCTPDTQSRVMIGELFYSSHIVIAYSKKTRISPVIQDLMDITIEAAPR